MVFGLVPRLQSYVLARYNWSEKARYYLEHPAGPFTIFFWCPFVKWCIVAANVSDLRIAPQNLSRNQEIAVTMTGLTWARNSTEIYPYNANLVLVNCFLAATGIYELFRIMMYKSKIKKEGEQEMALAN